MHYAMIGDRRIELTPLEAIRIVASEEGYEDVDVEPGNYGWQVTATGPGLQTIVVRGPTQSECCEKFCSKVG